MNETFQVGINKVGKDSKVYFIADIAANHDGSLDRAVELIHKCAEAGANAAKFQNFSASTIVSDYGFKTLDNQLSHQKKWDKSVFDVYDSAAIPLEWTRVLKSECDKANIDYFTAPYDISMIPELEKYVCAWKVGSGDITWHKSIEIMSKSNKPVFLATGASNIEEVESAFNIAKKFSNDICVMQCNTNYTGSLENFKYINLSVIKTYLKKFEGVVVGLSDHTPGCATTLGAIALGAKVIEKHFTDNTSRPGPDHAFSIDFQDWKDMVDRSRELELSLGSEIKKIEDNELETSVIQRRSIRTKRLIKKNEILTEDMVINLRPCPRDALEPWKLNSILGKKVLQDIPAGDYLKAKDIAK